MQERENVGRTMVLRNVKIANATVLITGAAGFIGASLAEALLRGRYSVNVVGIDNLDGNCDFSLKKYRLSRLEKAARLDNGSVWTFVKGSVSDPKFVDRIFDIYRPQIVVHLAARTIDCHIADNAYAHFETYIIGLRNLFEACRFYRSEHLLYASSFSVYGLNSEMPFSILAKTDEPLSPCVASQKSGELLAYSYSKMFGIPSTGLRFFTVYGPAGRPDMAYFAFTDQLLRGESIQLYNNGHCRRDYIYIDDAVDGIIKIMQRSPERRDEDSGKEITPHRIYNIGTGRAEKLLDFTEILLGELVRAEILPQDFDFDSYRTLVCAHSTDADEVCADISELERDIGFKPQVPLRVGLRRFAEWYKEYYGV